MFPAAILDCLFLHFFFSEDVLVTPKVGNCGSDVVQALVIAIIVVVIDKDTNLFLRIAWQVIISQQHAVFMVWCQRSTLPCVWGWNGAPRTWFIFCSTNQLANSPDM